MTAFHCSFSSREQETEACFDIRARILWHPCIKTGAKLARLTIASNGLCIPHGQKHGVPTTPIVAGTTGKPSQRFHCMVVNFSEGLALVLRVLNMRSIIAFLRDLPSISGVGPSCQAKVAIQ